MRTHAGWLMGLTFCQSRPVCSLHCTILMFVYPFKCMFLCIWSCVYMGYNKPFSPSWQHKSQSGLSDAEDTVTMTTGLIAAMNGRRRGMKAKDGWIMSLRDIWFKPSRFLVCSHWYRYFGLGHARHIYIWPLFLLVIMTLDCETLTSKLSGLDQCFPTPRHGLKPSHGTVATELQINAFAKS